MAFEVGLKFQTATKSGWEQDDFTLAIIEAYDSTPDLLRSSHNGNDKVEEKPSSKTPREDFNRRSVQK